MKTNELKKGISKQFDIPLKDIRIRQDRGWIHLYIRDTLKAGYNFKDFREERDFLRSIEKYVIENTNVYTFTSDDGYGTEDSCILSDFDSFEYI